MVYKIWKIHKKTPILEFHFKQSCRLNNFKKNLRKHLCRSLIFNKGIYSFAFFYWAACNKIQAFCKINLVCTGSELESLGIVCILPIPYLMSGVSVKVCRKISKSKNSKTRQGSLLKVVNVDDFLLRFFSFFMVNVCLLEISQIPIITLAILQ